MMSSHLPACVLSLLALACAAPAEGPNPPAGNNQPPKPEDRILQRLEKAGDEHQRLQADVRFEDRDRLTGDHIIRTGTVSYQKAQGDKSGRFAIAFDTVQHGQDAQAIRDRVDYAFDGQWFSILKHRAKQQMRFQVARNDQVVAPLKIGKGPFPLPIGQKAKEVKKYFQVTTDAPDLSRPKLAKLPEADYVCLTVKPQYLKEMDFVVLEMWVDRQTGLPVRVISHKGARPSRRAIKRYGVYRLKNIQKPEKFAPDKFLPPRRRGWTYDVKPLPARAAAQGGPAGR
jgi:hypothetical protein